MSCSMRERSDLKRTDAKILSERRLLGLRSRAVIVRVRVSRRPRGPCDRRILLYGIFLLLVAWVGTAHSRVAAGTSPTLQSLAGASRGRRPVQCRIAVRRGCRQDSRDQTPLPPGARRIGVPGLPQHGRQETRDPDESAVPTRRSLETRCCNSRSTAENLPAAEKLDAHRGVRLVVRVLEQRLDGIRRRFRMPMKQGKRRAKRCVRSR
jgi:hypothetical protein